MLMAGDHIEPIPDIRHRRRNRAGPGDEEVGAPVRERLLTQPDQIRREPISRLHRGRTRASKQVAARDVDLMVERQGDRLPTHGSFEITVVRHDSIDDRRTARVSDDDLVTPRYLA